MGRVGCGTNILIALILKKAGADVTVEENGKLAVEKVLAAMNRRRESDPERPFDIILMDMHMPVMDGYEATSLLRQKGCVTPNGLGGISGGKRRAARTGEAFED